MFDDCRPNFYAFCDANKRLLCEKCAHHSNLLLHLHSLHLADFLAFVFTLLSISSYFIWMYCVHVQCPCRVHLYIHMHNIYARMLIYSHVHYSCVVQWTKLNGCAADENQKPLPMFKRPRIVFMLPKYSTHSVRN